MSLLYNYTKRNFRKQPLQTPSSTPLLYPLSYLKYNKYILTILLSSMQFIVCLIDFSVLATQLLVLYYSSGLSRSLAQTRYNLGPFYAIKIDFTP